MEDATQTVSDPYAETPELHERIDRIGFRLVASTTVMFFLGFVFAYFYLRSLNNADMWRPHGTDPPQSYGIFIVVTLVLSAAAFGYADRSARAKRPWVLAAGIAVVLGLAACIAQGFEYAHIPFGPQSGGYASVFIGWTALYTVVALLSLYQLETIFAAGMRHRSDPDPSMPTGFGPSAFYWTLLVGIGVLAYVVLYLV